MQLPGEISDLVDKSEKSAEVIVPRVNEWFYVVKMNRLNVYSERKNRKITFG